MIRPLTCITLVMAACSGLYLYQTKARTLTVDYEIARTLKTADVSWQRANVLKAEYALLNDPSRLQDLASQHLPTLQTTAPGQFSTLADLDKRLPPVGPPPGPPAAPAATPDTTPPVAAAPNPDNAVVAHLEPPRAEPPRAEPGAELPHPAPVATVPRPPAPVPAPVTVAALPKPVSLTPPRVQTPLSRPAPTPLPVTPVAVIHPGPVAPTAPAVVRSIPTTPAPFVGSALGMARTMRPSAPSDSNGLR